VIVLSVVSVALVLSVVNVRIVASVVLVLNIVLMLSRAVMSIVIHRLIVSRRISVTHLTTWTSKKKTIYISLTCDGRTFPSLNVRSFFILSSLLLSLFLSSLLFPLFSFLYPLSSILYTC
jgi:hypothetical protein